ncbi:hypothetical protein V8C86DRAFT_3084737 [Haematococcus lacustris]
MYPEGPDGPRTSCEELVPDPKNPDGPLKLCGGIGTVNRLKSEIHSYSDKVQRCNVLCHVHNTKDESRQNGELATAAAAAAEAALAAKKGAAKKGTAKKGAAKKGAGSKECPIAIDRGLEMLSQADRVKLQQVMFNLLGNAARFTHVRDRLC